MKRRLRVVAGVAVLLAVILGIAYFVVAPRLVKDAIVRWFAQRGEQIVALEVERLTLTSARFGSVSLGRPQWLAIRQVDVTYTPRSLWRGEVKTLSINGANWTVRQNDDGFDLGLNMGTSPGETSGDLPFDRVELRDSAVSIVRGETSNSLSVSGTLDHMGSGRLKARARLNGSSIHYAGIAAMHMELEVEGESTSFGPEAIAHGTIELRAPDVRWADQDVGVRGIDATVPFAFNTSPKSSGRLQTGAITFKDVTLPGLSGSVSIAQSRVRSEIQWPLTRDATLQADGWLEIVGGSLLGKINATIPSFELIDHALVRGVSPRLENVTLGGQYSMDATVDISHGAVQPRITIRGESIVVQGEDWPGSVDDAEFQFTLTGFDPLTTEPDQVLFINRATIGEVDVTNASVAFTLETANQLRVHRAAWRMANSSSLGNFALDSFSVNPANPTFSSTLRCEAVGLGAWLELMTSERVTGSGTLEGLVSFAFDPSQTPVVTLGDGVLRARPSQGNIRIKDRELAERLIAQISVGEQKYALQVKDRIVAALRDFQYSTLEVELSPEGDDYVCELRTAGKGRVGPDAQEFAGIDVSIHNFNTLLRDAITGRNIYERLRE